MNTEDVLKELNKHDLEVMLTILEQHLPHHVLDYNYILNYLTHYDYINKNRKNIYSDRWNRRFFGHRYGNIQNCTVVSLPAAEASPHYLVALFTLESSSTELKECLLQSKLIQWKHKEFNIVFNEEKFEVIKNIVETKSNTWNYDDPMEYIMYISKEKIHLLPDIDFHKENVFTAPLSFNHADIVNENWKYKNVSSTSLIEQSILLNGGTGLFQKSITHNDVKLISWIITNDFLSPGFLHTLSEERCKGFAKIVYTTELKRLQKTFNIGFCASVDWNNDASMKLHRQLGFVPVNSVRWIHK